MNKVICQRCVLDNQNIEIFFDKNGYCNFCEEYLNKRLKKNSQTSNDNKLDETINLIKQSGKNKRYDCIVGVSGGVDSSWVLKKAIDLNLRVLAVHMDNGWNSELAQNNIANLIKSSGVDLYTHVIDWEEYRNLMQSFFDADVVDVELLYDNAMLALNYRIARKFGIKYILGGTNTATEGMTMPSNWNWFKYDKKNIIGISNKFTKQKLNSFPSIGILGYFFYEFFYKIKWISILDYMDYEKFEAMKILSEDYGYKPYPYKHYESVFTRFYQGYILPKKFGIDKRKLHLSTLILNNVLSREEALKDLSKIPYPDQFSLDEDVEYFLKKMNWSQEELSDYLRRARIEHDKYPSSKFLWSILKNINIFYARYFGKGNPFQPNR